MVELPPDADPLAKPRQPFDPEAYGLRPNEVEGDRWLVDAARGDETMLLLLREQEIQADLQRQGRGASDTAERLAKLRSDIVYRGEVLDTFDARP